MAMVIDPDAAAYGIFQIAFATLDTRLSRSVLALGRRKNPEITFGTLKRTTFGRRLKKVREAIDAVRPNFQNDPAVENLGMACDLAENVQKWRNDRIHAEVRFCENQPCLADEDGKPLQIDQAASEQKTREAIKAGIAMETAAPHLVAHELDLEELIEER